MLMLDRDIIQGRGFRNLVDGDRNTGFQFQLRNPNYRGTSASLLDGIDVTIDGEKIPDHLPVWTLQGRTFSLDELRASTVVATTAADRAEDAQDDADAAAGEALAARDTAAAAADSANAEAAAVGEEKTRLIADLARLQDISVTLAERRQAGLEERARAAAAAAAEREARRQARQAAAEAAAEAAEQQAAADAAEQADQDEQDADDSDDSKDSGQHKQAVPDAVPPAPGAGVPAVLAFARAQLGEPYRWGASGPSAWDCSGLTAGAWAAAGKSLPHYSVAQYEQSTPIRSSDLRPGDLVFWGSSSSPSSIYHVALYAGNGKIIHAPRTGKPVTEESMYYWIPPGFFARP